MIRLGYFGITCYWRDQIEIKLGLVLFFFVYLEFPLSCKIYKKPKFLSFQFFLGFAATLWVC